MTIKIFRITAFLLYTTLCVAVEEHEGDDVGSVLETTPDVDYGDEIYGDNADCPKQFELREVRSFYWTIANFSRRAERSEQAILSPLFPLDPLAPVKWKVAFYPHGRSKFGMTANGKLPALYLCLAYQENDREPSLLAEQRAHYRVYLLRREQSVSSNADGWRTDEERREPMKFMSGQCHGRVFSFGRPVLLRDYVTEDDIFSIAYEVRRYTLSPCPTGDSYTSHPPTLSREKCMTVYKPLQRIFYKWRVLYNPHNLTAYLMDNRTVNARPVHEFRNNQSGNEWDLEVKAAQQRLTLEMQLQINLCFRNTIHSNHVLAIFNLTAEQKNNETSQSITYTQDETGSAVLFRSSSKAQMFCWLPLTTEPFPNAFRDKTYLHDKLLMVTVNMTTLEDHTHCGRVVSDDSECYKTHEDPLSELRRELYTVNSTSVDVALASDVLRLAHNHGMPSLKKAMEEMLILHLNDSETGKTEEELLAVAEACEADQLKAALLSTKTPREKSGIP